MIPHRGHDIKEAPMLSSVGTNVSKGPGALTHGDRDFKEVAVRSPTGAIT